LVLACSPATLANESIHFRHESFEHRTRGGREMDYQRRKRNILGASLFRGRGPSRFIPTMLAAPNQIQLTSDRLGNVKHQVWLTPQDSGLLFFE
jgi:hypothetical protein